MLIVTTKKHAFEAWLAKQNPNRPDSRENLTRLYDVFTVISALPIDELTRLAPSS